MIPLPNRPNIPSMAKTRTIAQRVTPSSIIKPSELIDIEEQSPLTLTDRRIFNLLLANAWPKIDQDVDHCISKKDLRGATKDTKRLDENIGRLQAQLWPTPAGRRECQARRSYLLQV